MRRRHTSAAVPDFLALLAHLAVLAHLALLAYMAYVRLRLLERQWRPVRRCTPVCGTTPPFAGPHLWKPSFVRHSAKDATWQIWQSWLRRIAYVLGQLGPRETSAGR
jgi:hypothetical protein